MKVSLVVLLATMREVCAAGNDASRNQDGRRSLNGYYYPVQSPTYNQIYKTPYPTHKPPTPYPTGRRPTPHPTNYPVPYPTPKPTYPRSQPTHNAYPNPYNPYNPYPQPPPKTPEPTPMPTPNPTPKPTHSPTSSPTYSPTNKPTHSPTAEPTASPTLEPSPEPSLAPSPEPTAEPSAEPTAEPSAEPSPEPSTAPSTAPTASPTASPSESPTSSEEPSEAPTLSEEPSESPTLSEEPSESPTESLEPTEPGTAPPTEVPLLPTIYEIICDEDNANTYGLVCAFVSVFPDLVLQLGGTAGRRLESDDVISRANLLLDPTGHRKLQANLNIEVLEEFLAGDSNIVLPAIVVDDITFFAPINSAWLSMPINILELIVTLDGQDYLWDILNTHIHVGAAIPFNRLLCGAELTMANGKDTITRCQLGRKYQVGGGNVGDLPEIVLPTNEEAINGLIHPVDQVILPAETESPSESPSSSPSSAPSLSPSSSPQ